MAAVDSLAATVAKAPPPTREGCASSSLLVRRRRSIVPMSMTIVIRRDVDAVARAERLSESVQAIDTQGGTAKFTAGIAEAV